MEMTVGGWAFMLISWGAIMYIFIFSFKRIFSKNTKVVIVKKVILRQMWVERMVLRNIKLDRTPNRAALLAMGIKDNEINQAMETLIKNNKVRTILDYVPFVRRKSGGGKDKIRKTP